MDTVSGGVFLAPTWGRSKNQRVPASDAYASFCERRSSLEDVRRGLARHRRAEDLDVRREKRQESRSRGEPDVDVDVVALRREAHEAAGRVDRYGDGALDTGQARGHRLGGRHAEVSGRDLLSGQDVTCGDATVEVRGI